MVSSSSLDSLDNIILILYTYKFQHAGMHMVRMFCTEFNILCYVYDKNNYNKTLRGFKDLRYNTCPENYL